MHQAGLRLPVCIGLLTAAALWFISPQHGGNAATSRVGTPAPEITGQAWLNAEPQQLRALQGKVVLVEFWTYGCYNCQNVEPYIKAWYKKYADHGLVVIGVHTPEFDHERQPDNVKRYLKKNDITYPVVIDNDFVTWRRYANWAWPTLYVIDKRGVIQHIRIGEGGYAQTERKIQALLAES